MMYELVQTTADSVTVRYGPDVDKAGAARRVRHALRDVALGGIAWRPIAKGLMDAPLGETVFGIKGNLFTIVEVPAVGE